MTQSIQIKVGSPGESDAAVWSGDPVYWGNPVQRKSTSKEELSQREKQAFGGFCSRNACPVQTLTCLEGGFQKGWLQKAWLQKGGLQKEGLQKEGLQEGGLQEGGQQKGGLQKECLCSIYACGSPSEPKWLTSPSPTQGRSGASHSVGGYSRTRESNTPSLIAAVCDGGGDCSPSAYLLFVGTTKLNVEINPESKPCTGGGDGGPGFFGLFEWAWMFCPGHCSDWLVPGVCFVRPAYGFKVEFVLVASRIASPCAASANTCCVTSREAKPLRTDRGGVLANSPQPWTRKRKRNFWYDVMVKSYVCVSRLRAVC